MCNKLHADSKPIPEEGDAYKLFFVEKENVRDIKVNDISQMVRQSQKYQLQLGEHSRRIEWNSSEYAEDGAFCGLPNFEDALNLLRNWAGESNFRKGCVLFKVRYFGGIGGHTDYLIINGIGWPIILFKGFELVKPVAWYESEHTDIDICPALDV